MTLIIYILFCHWICDFILQTDWMARNKSHSLIALGLHILSYTLGLIILLGSWTLFSNTLNNKIFFYCLINGILHLITDFITSKISARLYKKDRIHDFFVIIGFDQFIHISTLLLTLNYL